MFQPKIDRISYGGALIQQEEKDAINAVIDSQGGRRWTIGPESEAFEEELAKNTHVARAVVVNSGSSALLVALTALHLPKGSKVIVPALNFPTAFNAILQVGCVPFVVDINPKTLLLDQIEVMKCFELQVSPDGSSQFNNIFDISAVIAVNIASNPVDLRKLRETVGPDVKIILDNCDGYGTTIDGGRYVERDADISCVSFHAAHIISTGEGGGILTDDEELADRCKKIREWGRASGTDKVYEYPGLPSDYRERYVYEEIGYNLKPLELQCAMGRVQLKRISDFKRRRQANYDLMLEKLSKYKDLEMIKVVDNAEVCWFSFPIMCRGIKRGLLMDHLEKNNIECRTIFSGNILRHPAYKDVEVVKHGEMTNADDVMFNGMFLSVHPSITKEMIEFIDHCIKEVCV